MGDAKAWQSLYVPSGGPGVSSTVHSGAVSGASATQPTHGWDIRGARLEGDGAIARVPINGDYDCELSTIQTSAGYSERRCCLIRQSVPCYWSDLLGFRAIVRSANRICWLAVVDQRGCCCVRSFAEPSDEREEEGPERAFPRIRFGRLYFQTSTLSWTAAITPSNLTSNESLLEKIARAIRKRTLSVMLYGFLTIFLFASD